MDPSVLFGPGGLLPGPLPPQRTPLSGSGLRGIELRGSLRGQPDSLFHARLAVSGSGLRQHDHGGERPDFGAQCLPIGPDRGLRSGFPPGHRNRKSRVSRHGKSGAGTRVRSRGRRWPPRRPDRVVDGPPHPRTAAIHAPTAAIDLRTANIASRLATTDSRFANIQNCPAWRQEENLWVRISRDSARI